MSGAFQCFRGTAIVAVVSVLAACSGGSSKQVTEGTSAAQIMALAQAEVDRGRYKNAAEFYSEVERLHPYSDEARAALIGESQAYREKQMYPESRAAASRYLDFFPTTSDAPLAMYLVALSYYDQIIDVERDQHNTFKALQIFRKLIDTYPGTKYATLSEQKFGVAMDQLAGKEMDIGRYYLKRHDYVAAIERFRVVGNNYGDTAQAPEALYRLVEAYLSLGLTGEASAAADILAQRFPDSQWRRDADQLVSRG